jgi:hypothetical protein
MPLLTRSVSHRFRPAAFVLVLSLGALFAAANGTAAEQDPGGAGLRRFSDDFSDMAAFPKNWVPYGRLANGQWAQGTSGHWREGVTYARAEWWQIVEGALRAQNFPDESHPAGISFRDRLAGVELILRCRIKIAPQSVGIIRVFGKSAGKFPPEKTDNHVTALEVSATGLKLWNGNRLRDDDPRLVPEAKEAGAAVKNPGRFHNTRVEKATERLNVAPEVWHELQLEVRRKHVRALFDQKEVLTFTLESDQPIESLSLEANGNKKEIGVVWFDDFSFEAK